jgi:hypothetical protein
MFNAHGQESETQGGGAFQLGLRTTWSVFGTDGYTGEGVGGQFRLRLHDRINTEWFADYITNNIQNLGRRTDGHIGWSVMFYPWLPKKPVATPYVLAGHCFDYTHVRAFSTYYSYNAQSAKRWSSAVQMGLGSHFRITDRADVSLSGQYMIHFGNDVHADVHEDNGEKSLHISTGNHGGVEGHLFITLSLNIKLAELW